ncbi:hypothetical protein P153DRAFT_329017 [Dothidotthia symphoricarpi CBS 119687]|uniref:Copper homeostasis protein cutC homolog n=1 Tax=Dothidotthia symphoricarpi CBS 119687 TaxID=1392245 RepID=A0A6A6AUD5_9PLEO|nr:uncharacterized protein P153DRAFT_329017 [Dothidotthia symphoricarpi CBS 119687]KAF2134564.1 hypothetical protein P153DRAFT_329017 [Dothidotthia symphoricarpi CBS 119687]
MLEIACFNLASVTVATKAGADRIELCDDYLAGGVTPSITSRNNITEAITIPINIMIRPRAGHFNYSTAEFEQMKSDIKLHKSWANGFVFGILDSTNRVDERNQELVQLADPLPCTFHRAIDEVEDLDEAVETVIAYGFKSILTSGGMKNAIQGAERVAVLQKTHGEKIQLILGGGVRGINALELKRKTGVDWLHSAAITKSGEEVDYEEVVKIKDVLKDYY